MQTRFGRIFLLFFITGYVCDLSIFPTDPVSVYALVGSDVTLAVTHTGPSHPVITWFMDGVPVVIWTFLDVSSPNVAPEHSDVLQVEQNGSLTLRNLSLGYNGTYTVEMTTIGQMRVSATFYLFVYEILKNVSLHTYPDEAVEGARVFTFYYKTMRGEAREVRWLFNGVQLEDGSRYTINKNNLTINHPSRNDTGRYTVILTNPFSSETQYRTLTVLYGPDMPVLKVSPTKAVFVSGDSLFLSCRAGGLPLPSVTWLFNGSFIQGSSGESINLTNVKSSQSGVYTCVLINPKTQAKRMRNTTVNIYEIPSGEPSCSVQAVGETRGLQFFCLWPGGAPEALLSFPLLGANESGVGNFSITPSDIWSLNGNEIVCKAEHPLIRTQCSVIPRGPADFQPVIYTNMSHDAQTTVVIHCNTEAVPRAVVYWLKNGQRLENGLKYRISINTSHLFIHHFNASSTDLDTYTCIAINPLSNITSNATLLGPQISDSSMFINEDRTEVTLKWEVPPNSVITGFDIQMKGPADTNFRTVLIMPGTARTTDVIEVNPKSTYYFKIIPAAGKTTGEESDLHQFLPDFFLGHAVVAGISAGIPCGIILFLIVIGVIYCGKHNRENKNPVSKSAEKVMRDSHHLPKERQKPPDYRPQQRSRATTMPPVRMATTV